MGQVKINGIRLNRGYTQVSQEKFNRQDQSCIPLYQFLESCKINMVFMTLSAIDTHSFLSGVISSKYFEQISQQEKHWKYHRDVTTISIYPHHYSLQFLGFLFALLGKYQLPFHHMLSSNALLTFIVDQSDCDAFIDMIASNFDLPLSHVPFEQAEDQDELDQFIKKRYPETRATYVEKKIKTYGITLLSDLMLASYRFSMEDIVRFGQDIQSNTHNNDKFFHTLVQMETFNRIVLSLLTKTSLPIDSDQTCPAELLSLQGPHFGDRHSIISRALTCLSQKNIPVLQTSCTGASIGIILPEGKGDKARDALTDVFEIP